MGDQVRASRGTLGPTEPHPVSFQAKAWLANHFGPSGTGDAHLLLEAFASAALAGNRAGEICGETLRRLIAGERVSDRYLLGLAWAVKQIEERKSNGEGHRP